MDLIGNLVVTAGRSTEQNASVKEGEAGQSTLGIVLHTEVLYLTLEEPL